MSRNKNVDYTKYIHEFIDEHGVQRFAVAEWDESVQKYKFVADKTQQKMFGVNKFQWVTKSKLNWQSGYLRRRQALRRARYLFGGK